MQEFNVTSPHKHIVYSGDSEDDEEENALGKNNDTRIHNPGRDSTHQIRRQFSSGVEKVVETGNEVGRRVSSFAERLRKV
ncbi:hypothetical protein LTS15_007571 [Exophiala xenobiotica]|nr:hypothetical protein LTS15_007571 [Exophiala xenobiotica]